MRQELKYKGIQGWFHSGYNRCAQGIRQRECLPFADNLDSRKPRCLRPMCHLNECLSGDFLFKTQHRLHIYIELRCTVYSNLQVSAAGALIVVAASLLANYFESYLGAAMQVGAVPEHRKGGSTSCYDSPEEIFSTRSKS